MESLPPYVASGTSSGGNPDALPSYDGSEKHGTFVASSGIDDKMPNHFKIDKQFTPPFVMPSDLQAHLILLGAFHRLKEEVQTNKGRSDIPMGPNDRWAIFLQRAVYRFERWATRMIGHDPEEEVKPSGRILSPNEYPPLDVLMVWHTYFLNPRTYYEDCIRNLSGLLSVGSFPLKEMCSTIDQEALLPHPAGESRSSAFASFTQEQFEPPITTTSDETATLYCPNCSTPNLVPWITSKGDGYAQREFITVCNEPQCRMVFDREILGVRKFYEDLEKCAVDSERHVLANTLVDHFVGLPNERLSKILTSLSLGFDLGVSPKRPEVFGQIIGWRMNNVEDYCREGFLSRHNRPYTATPRPLGLILSAYRVPGPFSIDLASAVLRQMSFIDKMVQIGWTEPGRFEVDHDTLTRCVVRYHHFIDLMGATPGKYVVPTLDIDLAWHTHQLLCMSYRKLFEFIGIVPDHDDKVSQGAISSAYDETAAAWKAKFGVPYSVCGCLPPSKANGMVSGGGLFSRKGKSKVLDSFNNPRPDLVAVEDTNAEETHPSDHNSVAIINPREENAAQAQLRRGEMTKRSKELGKLVDKSKADQFGVLSNKRVLDHTLSFLHPVEYGVNNPFGKNGNGDCASLSGGGVKGIFGIGECVKGGGFQSLCAAAFERPRDGLANGVTLAYMNRGQGHMLQDLGVANLNSTYGMFGAYGM